MKKSPTDTPKVTIDELLADYRDDNTEFGLVMRRSLEREKTGIAPQEAWRMSLAEQLRKAQRREDWSRELLELAAEAWVKDYEPKLKVEWESPPESDRRLIDIYAKILKKRGVRACRTEAEKFVAWRGGISVHALRKRRYRPRGSRRRQKV